MDFKFGWYIRMVHPNKSPLKILEKRERGPLMLKAFVIRSTGAIRGTAESNNL